MLSERFQCALVHLHESLLCELFHDFRVIFEVLLIEAKSVILGGLVRHRVGNSATEAWKVEFVVGRGKFGQNLLREGTMGGVLLHSQHVEGVPADVDTGLPIVHIVVLEE